MPTYLTGDPYTAERRAVRQEVAAAIGMDSEIFKGWCDQFRAQFLIEDMATWPIQPGAPLLQDQATGALYFIPGISDPGGTDILP